MFSVMPFFTNFALDAEWDKQPGKVIIDSPDTRIFGDMVTTSETMVLIPSDQWKDIDEGDVIIVKKKTGLDATYRLQTIPEAFDDGELKRAHIVKT